LGTERHEARRIDDQLRGRSGRLGDPGSSQFFVSMEDELMRRFGSDKVKSMMDTLGIPDDEPIENRMVSRSIEKAQGKIEGHNLDIRKHVLEYDDVMNKQREIIYQRRRTLLLDNVQLKDDVKNLAGQVVQGLVDFHAQPTGENGEWRLKEIGENARALFGLSSTEQSEIFSGMEETYKRTDLVEHVKKEEIAKFLKEKANKKYQDKEELIGTDQMRQVERAVMLRTIDMLWMEHLDNMQYLREGIGLRGYGQRDPLVEYKQEGFRMFEQLLKNIDEDALSTLYKIEFVRQPQQQQAAPIQESPEIKNRLAQATYSQPEEPTGMSEGDSDGDTSGSKTIALSKSVPKVGRNDPCPCGSGKKYKKCHGKK